jgi:hypothetical protein
MRAYNDKRKFILIPFAIAAFLAVTGFVVMSLWNYLLPGILHVGVITFWQALGIFILCKILFGFGHKGHRWGGGGAPWMRRKMEDRFRNMSPEEREKFKAHMRDRCGHNRWGKHGGHSFDAGWDDAKEPKAESSES